jgi:hypothetical protein
MEADIKCAKCGNYFSKIIQLIEEEQAYEQEHSLQGSYQRVKDAPSLRHGLVAETKLFFSKLDKKAKFTLFVVFVFVFAMIVSVL